ncbi:MAG: hypothetical protein ABWX73_04645, partial [Marmoricola sp.]
RLRRARSWPADAWVFVVGGIALLTYALHGFNGMLTRDLAVYSYAGQQVADGVPPYVGILNRAGPLAHAIPAVGVGIARVGHFDDLVGMRSLFLAIAVLCVCAVYLLGRDVFASRSAGLVAAATFLTFSGFISYASNGPREKTPMTLFITCALWAVARGRWFTAGLFVSLATLCLQIAFWSSFTAVVAGALFLAHGHRLRALLRVAAGGVLPVAAFTAWFALTGSLRDAADAFLLINIRYTTPDPVLDKLDEVWLDLQTAYGISLWLIIAGLVALAVLSLAVVTKRGRAEGSPAVLLAAFALGAAAGLAWNLKDYDAWPDLFPVLPFAAVGIAGLFHALTRRLSSTVAVVVAVVLCLVATGVAVVESVTTRDDRLEVQRESVAAVLAQAPAHATITSVEAPQALVLTRRTNPTRHQMFSGGLQDYLDDTWPGGMTGVRQGIVDAQPDLIVFGDPVSNRWRAAIQPEYVYLGSAPDWSWYARASLGEERIAALRAAAGYDPEDPLAQPPPQ